MPDAIPVRSVIWRQCWRVIPSRYPEARLYDRVADPADVEALVRLERLTNHRARQVRGEIDLMPSKERVTGPGSQYIMAPFTYLNPLGSRFSDGSFGVYYAARTLDTAIRESRYHRERFMRDTQEPPMRLGMRVLVAHLNGRLHDIRGKKRQLKAIYSPTSYATSQPLGVRLRHEQSGGIVYDSVRDPRGECAAVFRPRLLTHCRQERHISYEWDGRNIRTIYELREHPRISS